MLRFFHIGDLHFGKLLHSILMVEEDQPFWIDEFLKKVDEYKPDAILIAGDVYDRKIPSNEAIKLLNYMLTQLSKRKVHVMIVAGNHDSSIRLSYAKDILCEQNIYIATNVSKEIEKVTMKDEYGEVVFWLLPYLYPKAVADKEVLDDDSINDYSQAVSRLLDEQEIDKSKRNVIVIHQNVLAGDKRPEHSDSERIIGGLGEIDVALFDDFDYVAMGHIHNAQAMGRDSARYAGCPMYYDFSEADREKYITMVELKGRNQEIEISKIKVPLLHEMKIITGSFEEVLEEGRQISNLHSYHIQVRLKERHLPSGAIDKLREVFGTSLVNVVKEKMTNSICYNEYNTKNITENKEKSVEDLFEEFYTHQNDGELLTSKQDMLIEKIIEQQSRYGNDLFENFGEVPKEDVDELVESLFGGMDNETA